MTERMMIDCYQTLYIQLVEILSDLLVVPAARISPQSLLVDDLDADSVSFLELSHRLNECFGIQMAEVKVDEETLNMNLVDGLEQLNGRRGEATFFEHVKEETIRRLLTQHQTAGSIADMLGVPLPTGMTAETAIKDIRLGDLERFGLAIDKSAVAPETLLMRLAEALPTLDHEAFFPYETRERLFRSQRVDDLVRGIDGRVPPGMSGSTRLSELLLRDMFRFLSVGAMARYLWAIYDKANPRGVPAGL